MSIECADGSDGWLHDADPSVSLETVRQILARVSFTLAQAVNAER